MAPKARASCAREGAEDPAFTFDVLEALGATDSSAAF
jgi:hypothetical protein